MAGQQSIKVSSAAIRNTSATLNTEAANLIRSFDAMHQQVKSFTGRMSGTTIDVIAQEFRRVAPVFDQMRMDMQSYGQWLSNAAEHYEHLEKEHTAKGQSIF